ncbi:MAG: hypothetical protein ACR2LI_08130 [Propionibacteriaceae bacterium]
MTSLKAQRDGADLTELATPLQLAELLHTATEFVVVERGTGAFAQAAVSGRHWVVEVVDQPELRRGVRADAPNTDAAYDLLRSWCTGDGWWAEAVTWRPFEI